MNDIFNPENPELKDAKFYNVGDIVLINPEIRQTIKGVGVVNGMVDLAGMPSMIARKIPGTRERPGYYRLHLDEGLFKWQDYMFLNDKIEPMNEQEVWSML